MTRQIVRFSAAVMITLLALLLLWQLRMVVVYVLLALTFAATVRPLFSRLVGRRRLVRGIWIVAYLALLGGFGFLCFLAAEAAINEIRLLANTISTQDAWRLPAWLEGSAIQRALVLRLPPPSMFFEAVTGDEGQFVLPAVLGFTQGIGSAVSGLLVILFLGLYWSINQVHFERLWLSLLPAAQRGQARGIWQIVEPEAGAYIRGQVVEGLLTGLLLGLGYWLLGSPFPVLLALTGALASLIPVVGAALAVGFVLFVGLLTSVQLSLLMVFYTLVVFVALGVWVKPRLFDRKWDNPILTVILLVALADAFGLIGIILAPPIAAICQILWSRLVSRRAASGAAAEISDLKERQARIRETITALDGPPLALVSSSMERLAVLIERAEPILQAGLADGQPSLERGAGTQ